MARVVVTGAAGFLGRHLVRASGGDVVRVVHRVTGESAPASSMEQVLADPDLLGRPRADILVHAAAIRHRHGTSAADYRASNVELVERLMRASAGRVGRFVFVSSVGVYGFPREVALPITETTPRSPRTLYSQTKIEGEKLVRRLGKQLGLPTTIVRPTILYGAGDRNGMLDKLAAMVRAGRYRIVGRGDNTLHHTHVEDAAAGILALASRPGAAVDEDFIVCGPETTTLRRLSELVARAVGAPLPRLHVPLAFARAVATGIDLAAYRGLAFAQGQRGKEPPINHEKLDVMTVSIAFDGARARAAGFTPRIGYEEGVAMTLGTAP
jgi:nucleoside-diphosphate-sugar epimerase